MLALVLNASSAVAAMELLQVEEARDIDPPFFAAQAAAVEAPLLPELRP
jgi:hypothetical protein